MPAASEPGLFIGLISGTSRDGVDAALVSIESGRTDLLHAFCKPYPPAIRRDLDDLLASAAPPARGRAGALDEMLGRFFARTARELAEQADVELRDISAIGSHGQTVWHQPEGDRPFSVQLGSGSVIARATGTRTVVDFRRADLMAGGQGAPLAPLVHRHLFHDPRERRVVLNIGGIANITVLETDGNVTGFDCGPGNCLMDAWIKKHRGEDFDAGGAWAAGGQVLEDLLEKMLTDPYFSLPAPKSTGLETFNLDWLSSMTGDDYADDQDIQCTLAELTARSIISALPGDEAIARLLVCGGGVHNAYLMFRLRKSLPDITVESTMKLGADPDWIEAILFAWLASERLAGRSQDTGPITGAREPVLLGKIHPQAV
jgi:anhydro-N-acetylmuramic acid kinase